VKDAMPSAGTGKKLVGNDVLLSFLFFNTTQMQTSVPTSMINLSYMYCFLIKFELKK